MNPFFGTFKTHFLLKSSTIVANRYKIIIESVDVRVATWNDSARHKFFVSRVTKYFVNIFNEPYIISVSHKSVR